MHYTAEIAKRDDPDCVTVFIGPCLAKRKEGIDDPYVDYVLSAEEVGALFMAKDIDIGECEALVSGHQPTATGRNFAQSGGVAEAVRVRLRHRRSLSPSSLTGSTWRE
jgi:iron only hydrogenase large subunit-like protein